MVSKKRVWNSLGWWHVSLSDRVSLVVVKPLKKKKSGRAQRMTRERIRRTTLPMRSRKKRYKVSLYAFIQNVYSHREDFGLLGWAVCRVEYIEGERGHCEGGWTSFWHTSLDVVARWKIPCPHSSHDIQNLVLFFLPPIHPSIHPSL
jgi:hypothetical protein